MSDLRPDSELHGQVVVLGSLVEEFLIESVNLLRRPDPVGLERLHDGAWPTR